MFSQCLYKKINLKLCTNNKNTVISYFGNAYRRDYSNNRNEDKRRVVITGIGVISPVGCQTETAWKNILEGYCAIQKLPNDLYGKLPCKIAAQIPNDMFNVKDHFSKTELKTMAPATTFALMAAKEALETSNWFPNDPIELQRTGVAVGMGMIDLTDVCETNEALKTGYNRVSPFFVPRILPNMAAGQISIKYGFRGPNHAVSTACATGAHSIGDAFRFIQHNDADVMVCGGAESCISPLAIAGFSRLRALTTTRNEEPEKSSRPFDKDRDGFVMGEGSAIFVLEELNHARKRNAKIIGEILGYGLSGDASHLTAPRDDGTGAILAMQRALDNAGIDKTSIGYINAHATSTPIGDAIETRAIKTLFGDHAKQLAVSSTKGAHGHLLGAAGNLETIFATLACRDGKLPPTINLDNLTDDMDLNYVPKVQQVWHTISNNNQRGRRIALKNAFGFGGTNASLCIAEYQE